MTKQRSTKHYYRLRKTNHAKNKSGDDLRCFGRMGIFCFNNGTYHVTLVTNLVISHERGAGQECDNNKRNISVETTVNKVMMATTFKITIMVITMEDQYC